MAPRLGGLDQQIELYKAVLAADVNASGTADVRPVLVHALGGYGFIKVTRGSINGL